MQQLVFDNGQSLIRWRRAGHDRSRAVVITFDYVGQNNPDEPGFGEVFLAAEGYDLVTVRKRGDNWYQDLSVAEFRDAVSPLVAPYARVFAYGMSMGAYAALYFAEAAGAVAIALSPRISIHPDYARFAAAEIPYRVALRHGSLAEAAGGPSPRPHLIVYDPCDTLDSSYVEQEVRPAFPGATYLRLPHSGHPTLHMLLELVRLKELVIGALEGRPAPATRALTRGVKGRSPTYLQTLALACMARGREHAAIRLCERAITLAPERAQPHGIRSTALHRLGRQKEAVAAAEAAVHCHPKDANLRAHLAWMVDRLGDLERALAELEAALALDDRAARLHAHRSMLLERLHRPEEALAAAEAAALRSPENADIQSLLARLRSRVAF